MSLITKLKNRFLAKELLQLQHTANDLDTARERDREERAGEREQFLTALTAITSHFASGQQSQAESVSQLAKASAAQAQAFQAHLSMFSFAELPTSRTLRDVDEFNNEVARSGFPTDAAPDEQLQWVLANT